MRSIAGLSTKILTTGFALALSVSCAMANTLSEIQINAENGTNGQSGYGIVLKTDEAAHMKKIINSEDKMSIELKNVEVSSSLNTVYNDVANIDNVTVAPISKNDIKIVFKGKDIASSKVYFETVKTSSAPSANETQSIQLSGPVSSYTPVYNPESFAVESEDSQTSNPELNEVLTKMHITRSMLVSVKKYTKRALKKAESSGVNPITAVGIIAIAAAFALRPRKKSADNARKRMSGVGLSAAQNRSNLDREMNLNSRMAAQMNTHNNSLRQGYGMKAYQSSQRNPYMTSNVASNGVSGIPRRPLSQKTAAPVKRKPVSSQPLSAASAPIKSLRKAPVMNNPIQPAASHTPLQHNSKKAQESDLDSMKFLESITKIYEKNGRADLAKGLKDNLRKAQMANI
ncbi:MAG: hypothetical protein KHX03_10155 [Clostridium sp.]|nr:hypothetical protein [Clostridium sp.]